MRQRLPERRQQRQGVEHPAEIGQRRQHEGRDQADVIKRFGEYRVQQTGQRKQDRRQEQRERDKQPRVYLERDEEQRNRRDQDPYAQPARHAATHVTGDDDVRRHRCHQQFFNVALEFGAKERRRHVGVGVGDHRHHDQTRYDKLHVGKAVHFTNAGANQVTKDNEIERHSDDRRHQGLHPDTHKAVNLFRPDALQRDPVKMRHALSPCLSCTRETNSSSSRFALLRILNT